VGKVSDLVAEIAAASREQSAGIVQVNGAVAQMEQVVQQNASLVEEVSAATESMKEEAVALFGLVSRFRLGDGAPAAPAATSRKAAPAPVASLPPLAAAPRGVPSTQQGWREF
jgi:hypothetical protein